MGSATGLNGLGGGGQKYLQYVGVNFLEGIHFKRPEMK
jgi:hypothetical protein